ncbi:Crp/Fnr family transcriptional regulator [Paraflavisolibacter sp. H34]|uniref:Crp/Fnr family transcriptional regulator n=1 Tax=Huijunlia imazamoxiresistens TaxID=3127457 RepID=UPI00301B1BBD
MKKTKHECDLKSCILCTTCLEDWLPALAGNRQCYQFNKGEEIFREGEPVNGIYFVYNGLVKIHKQWGHDREMIVHFVRKGDILGHRGLGRNGLYPVSATALEPVQACFLEMAFFRSTLRVNNEFLFQLMVNCVDELEESERKMRNLVHLPVKGRVAQALLSLKEKFGCTESGHIDVALSRQDLASVAGTTYETAFRILSEMIQEGTIEMNGKYFTIRDKEKLMSNITSL